MRPPTRMPVEVVRPKLSWFLMGVLWYSQIAKLDGHMRILRCPGFLAIKGKRASRVGMWAQFRKADILYASRSFRG